MVTELIRRARAGDEEAFHQLIEPHRRELHVHCYRILGSLEDAEDALQESLLAAWRGLDGFEQRASLRTWLYRIATNRCLNALRAAKRHPQTEMSNVTEFPEPTNVGEIVWLDPCPDALLEGLVDARPGPDARFEARETISLAFMTAVQALPPRQRVVLILRDVLGFRASEAASMLEVTEESVTSALKRARAALSNRGAVSSESAPVPHSVAERDVVDRLVRAFEERDARAIVALLSENVRFTMPPLPLEYHGRDAAAQFLAAVMLQPQRTHRVITTRANGQPAFVMYMSSPGDELFRPLGLFVVTLAGAEVSAITRFDSQVLPRFGLPLKLAQ